MQCSNCQFENMPGVETCGRCGARLDLATVAVNVYPPRAGRWLKRLHRLAPFTFRLRRWRWQIADAMISAFGAVTLPRPAPGLFLRMVVPGWPQIHCGQVIRGRIFFFGYVGALALGVLFAGTQLGSILLGLALSLHASSVLDVVMRGTRDWSTRTVYSLFCFLALAVGLYWPASWLVGRVAVPRRIAVAAPPFEAGDVLWYGPAAYRRSPPEVGDVVLYQIPTVDIAGRTPGGQNAMFRITGERVDRVVAGPGQQVEWIEQGLVVDGQTSPWRPLNPNRVPTGWKTTVPARYVCIVPSTTVVPPGATARLSGNLAQTSLVPIRSVRGKVYFRSQPLGRIGWIR